jgi:CHAD domain
MAPAARVRDIHPGRSLRENAAKVIAFRLHELLQWRPALEDPSLVSDLHNMRIAAKRLRYAIETFSICFDGTKAILKDLTDVQEDLGDIHDLDVLTDVLRSRLRALDEPLESQVVDIMGADASQAEKSASLRRLSSQHARDPRRIGLLGLLGDKINDRRRRYAGFQQRWSGEGLKMLTDRIVSAIEPGSAVSRQPSAVSQRVVGVSASEAETVKTES